MVALLRAFLLELVFEAAASARDCKALKITTGFHVGENRGSHTGERFCARRSQHRPLTFLISFCFQKSALNLPTK